jgi:hypothetical protein
LSAADAIPAVINRAEVIAVMRRIPGKPVMVLILAIFL